MTPPGEFKSDLEVLVIKILPVAEQAGQVFRTSHARWITRCMVFVFHTPGGEDGVHAQVKICLIWLNSLKSEAAGAPGGIVS